MANSGKFQPGKSGNPATQFKPGNRYRWQPVQSGNPAGVARSRLKIKESSNAVLLGHASAEDVANLLCEAVREQEPWAIEALALLLRLARQQINVKKIRPERMAVKVANERSIPVPEAAATGGDLRPPERLSMPTVAESAFPQDTEENSSGRASLNHRYEEFCQAKVKAHLRALTPAIRSQRFDETRSAIRRAVPQLRLKEVDEMAQRELESKIRAGLHLPSVEEFSV